VGTGCLGFGSGPNKVVDYFPSPLGKLITLVPRLGTNQLIFRIAKNLIEGLKHNNWVT
jgi:hypothetical protein